MHFTRRSLVGALGCSIIPAMGFAQPLPTPEEFDTKLDAVLADDDALELVRGDREGKSLVYSTRGRAPRLAPSSRLVSQRAVRLIVGFEVTNQQRYELKYTRPIWPHGASGVTVGIGYDIGYVTKAWLHEDWKGILSVDELKVLEIGCGVTGTRAKALLPQVSNIAIPWDKAYRQFTTTSLPRYTAQTLSALPRARELSDDSLGALVSLTYNRGASYAKEGPRYAEMRAIRLAVWSGRFSRIPTEIRSMQKWWTGVPKMEGLVKRRELEAQLFELGLQGTA